jgi:peptidoglycan hydrolase-like protein with peptidoglycan-binding domain
VTANASVARPLLQVGATGDAVKTLQQGLVNAGYPVGTDGNFGPGTQNAVKQFQQAQGLTADGVVGAQTLNKLGV